MELAAAAFLEDPTGTGMGGAGDFGEDMQQQQQQQQPRVRQRRGGPPLDDLAAPPRSGTVFQCEIWTTMGFK